MSTDRLQIAISNLRTNYAMINMIRKTKQIKVIEYIEPTNKQNIQNKSVPIAYCQATTMAGNRCKFKAVCGDYCKKHKL